MASNQRRCREQVEGVLKSTEHALSGVRTGSQQNPVEYGRQIVVSLG